MRLLIVGAGGFGRAVMEVAQSIGRYQISGFLDDALPLGHDVSGYQVMGRCSDLLAYRDRFDEVIIAVGSNLVREAIFENALTSELVVASLIATNAIVSKSTKIGRGVIVMPGAVVSSNVTIEDGVLINCGASVDHDCTLQRFSHLGVNVTIAGGSHIGARGWFKAGCVVGSKMTTPPDFVVGAGQSHPAAPHELN